MMVQSYRDFDGFKRIAAAKVDEAARIDAVKDGAALPGNVGPVPDAPGRGAVEVVNLMRYYPDGDDDFVLKPAGHLGRQTVRVMDVFDRMAAQAKRAGRVCGLKTGHVMVARDYRNTVERWEAAGVKCSSVERVGGSGGDFMDAVLRDRAAVMHWRRLIGVGCALAIRRVRPSASGGRGRRVIMDRDLVDMVCIGDLTIDQVLDRHGWSIKKDTRDRAKGALMDALDRMRGPTRGAGVQTWRDGV